MSACPNNPEDLMAYLRGDLEEGRRTTVAEHLKECADCRREAEELGRVLDGADAVRGEIHDALRSVDWEALPRSVAEYVYRNAGEPEKASVGERVRGWFLRAGLKPVAAVAGLGVLVGAVAMYLVLKGPAPGPGRAEGFYASGEFLDRAELEMARRDTVSYLEKSQFLLRDFAAAPAGEEGRIFRASQAQELLAKKKYLNRELEKFQMAKAKAICDQIEMLFLELAQIGDEMPEAELARIRDMVQERQLFLKINLVKKELQSGV